MDINISVIIPVYNSEKYLRDCLNSIQKQTMKEIEVIIINDGSTDSSREICEEFIRNDKRFRLTTIENQGQGNARNIGISQSKGKYLMFVDSDDQVDKDYCKIPYQIAEKNQADVVLFSYIRNINGTEKASADMQIQSGPISNKDAMNLVLRRSVGTFVWNKLFSRRLFDDVSFPTGMWYEDVGTTYKLIHRAKNIYYIDKPLYVYYQRPLSTTQTKNRKKEEDRYANGYKRIKDFEKWNDYCMDFVDWLKIRGGIRYLVKFGSSGELYKEWKQCINEVKGYPDGLSTDLVRLLRIYRLSPFLFDAVCKISGKRYK